MLSLKLFAVLLSSAVCSSTVKVDSHADPFVIRNALRITDAPSGFERSDGSETLIDDEALKLWLDAVAGSTGELRADCEKYLYTLEPGRLDAYLRLIVKLQQASTVSEVFQLPIDGPFMTNLLEIVDQDWTGTFVHSSGERPGEVSISVESSGLQIVSKVTQGNMYSVFIRVGAGFWGDPKTHGGMAHLVEHFLCRDFLFAELNLSAKTFEDHTEYEFEAEDLLKVQQVLTKFKNNIKTLAEFVRDHREFVKEEIAVMYYENFNFKGSAEFYTFLLDAVQGLPFPTIGSPRTLESVHATDLERYLRQYYTLENMVVVIQGKLASDMEETVQKAFEEWPFGNEETVKLKQVLYGDAVLGKTLTIYDDGVANPFQLMYFQVLDGLKDYVSLLSVALSKSSEAGIDVEFHLKFDRLLIQCSHAVPVCTDHILQSIDALVHDEVLWESTKVELLRQSVFPVPKDKSVHPSWAVWIADQVSRNPGVLLEVENVGETLQRQKLSSLREMFSDQRRTVLQIVSRRPPNGHEVFTDPEGFFTYSLTDNTEDDWLTDARSHVLDPSWKFSLVSLDKNAPRRLFIHESSWLRFVPSREFNDLNIFFESLGEMGDKVSDLLRSWETDTNLRVREANLPDQTYLFAFLDGKDQNPRINVIFKNSVPLELGDLLQGIERDTASQKLGHIHVEGEVAVTDFSTFLRLVVSIIRAVNDRPDLAPSPKHPLAQPVWQMKFRSGADSDNPFSGRSEHELIVDLISSPSDDQLAAASILLPFLSELFWTYVRHPSLTERSGKPVLAYVPNLRLFLSEASSLTLSLNVSTKEETAFVQSELLHFLLSYASTKIRQIHEHDLKIFQSIALRNFLTHPAFSSIRCEKTLPLIRHMSQRSFIDNSIHLFSGLPVQV